MSGLLRYLLLGAVTGGRSMTGPAVVALTGPGPAGTRARRLVVLAAGAEIVVDKLPGVPSRTAPPALAVRLVLAGVCAAALARRGGTGAVVPVLTAASGALAGSFAGARWRAWAGGRAMPALAAALLEDLAVIGTAAVVSRHTFGYGPRRVESPRPGGR
ncbi:hypothetical protein [Actinoplanes sp. NPDC049118]|uniref:hypothetical protein n=1 Tax=Actinoplanes sp. NPDC049118 TaxID=3155769 RepID=UPI0033F08E74